MISYIQTEMKFTHTELCRNRFFHSSNETVQTIPFKTCVLVSIRPDISLVVLSSVSYRPYRPLSLSIFFCLYSTSLLPTLPLCITGLQIYIQTEIWNQLWFRSKKHSTICLINSTINPILWLAALIEGFYTWFINYSSLT